MESSVAKKTTKKVSKDKIKSAYIEHVLLHGSNPSSIFAFAKSLKISEADFYQHYNSFKSLDGSIWSGWFQETIKTIEQDEAYAGYTIREKLLAFYFTWSENLKTNRSFVLKRFEGLSQKDLNPYFLSSIKFDFSAYINDLLMEGKDTNEVAERPFSSQYDKAFWVQFVFINRFWVNDESQDFEKTDAAIEKSVNLALDLVGYGAVDSMMDFGKFLFQNRSF